MKRFGSKWTAIAALFVLLIVTACEGEKSEPSALPQPPENGENAAGPAAGGKTENGIGENASGAGIKENAPGAGRDGKTSLSMSEWITELTLCEKDPPPGTEGAGSSNCMASFGTLPHANGKMPVAVDVDRFAIYMRDLYFFVSFDRAASPELIRQLVGQIEADGGELVIRKEHEDNEYRYKGEVTGVDRPLTLRAGDLPPIRIIPGLPPLAYSVEMPESSDPSLLLFGEDYGTHLVVPAETETVTLAFSEPVRTGIASAFIEHPGGNRTPVGKWVDDRRLQLDLSEIRQEESAAETIVLLDRVYAESGAYLADRHSAVLHIRKVPESRWLRYPSGRPALESPYAGFYDFILFSPDRSKRIGLVELGGAIGDGIGAAYGVLVEKPGARPEIIRHSLHMPGALEKPSIVWAGNDRIAFYDHTGIYLYDTETRRTARILDYAEAEGYPNFIAYDGHADEILLYMQVRRGSDEGTLDIDLRRFPAKDPGAAAAIKSFTATILENKYFFAQLPIVPAREGIYLGQAANGKFHTVFAARDGRSWTAEGLPAALFGDRIILRSGGDRSEWFIWKPGTEPAAIPVPEDAWVRPFGHYLVWQQSSDHRWKLYDPETGKVSGFPLIADGARVPFQPYDALYRVSTAP